jgi:outer membrane lipoprotein-sorting protein
MKTMKKIILFVLILVFAAGFLMTGCKTGTTTNSDGTTADNADSSDGTSLKDIMTGKVSDYKVTYDMKMTADGETQESTFGYAIKGTNKFRWDFYDKDNKATSYAIMADNMYYMCAKQGTETNCFKMQMNEQQTNPDAQLSDYADENKYSPLYSGTKVIAGKTAYCYKVTEATSQYDSEFCVSKEGIMLYAKTTAQNTISEMTATQYSTSVPDSDFAVPANVQDMSQYMQN